MQATIVIDLTLVLLLVGQSIDGCASNPCRDGTCQDLNDRFRCDSVPGWTGVNCERDVDECITNGGQGPCDPYFGICQNLPGSYRCWCRNGFELTEDQHGCKDIDECMVNEGRGMCDHICTDTIGSYRCSCRDGYDLGSDGFSCVDSDDCRSNPCQNGATCHDGNENYSCECRIGFKGKNCELAPCSEDFAPPEHGSVTCADVSTGGRFCTVACNDQHDFACRPADGYTCDPDGNWHQLGRPNCNADQLPEDAPWPDCSRWRLAWFPQMANAVNFYYDGDCQSNFAEIIQMFNRLYNSNDGAAASCFGTCYIENINVACGFDPAKICENLPDDTYRPHPYDCSMYVQCRQTGQDAVFNCPPGTLWSQELTSCARSDLVTCDSR